MALIHCNFFSEVLGISASMDVILPQLQLSQMKTEGNVSKKYYPTLYLLHGLSDDHTIWQRRTSIERYAAPLGLAVVMPAAGRSFYCDMEHGYKYWTFISEEVPALARQFFPLSPERKDNFVAGLSMGGYGAMKLGLRCPDKFAMAGSFSGALDVTELPNRGMNNDSKLIFGDKDPKGTENDLFYLVDKLIASGAPRPIFYQCCGTEDYLYHDNIRFKKHCEKQGLEVIYEEGPGTHEWGYWDKMIQSFLEKLPLAK